MDILTGKNKNTRKNEKMETILKKWTLLPFFLYI